jgi:hypothetical protein
MVSVSDVANVNLDQVPKHSPEIFILLYETNSTLFSLRVFSDIHSPGQKSVFCPGCEDEPDCTGFIEIYVVDSSERRQQLAMGLLQDLGTIG